MPVDDYGNDINDNDDGNGGGDDDDDDDDDGAPMTRTNATNIVTKPTSNSLTYNMSQFPFKNLPLLLLLFLIRPLKQKQHVSLTRIFHN